MQKNEERRIIFTTNSVNDITDKINDGYIPKRFQNPWFKGEIGVRRAGLIFKLTEEELEEYIKCKLDIHYFAEKYCRIKTEDGSVQNIKLRDYQKKILDLYTKNRFSMLLGSRQCGKTVNAAITMLHFITFNNDKNIMIVANQRSTTVEIIDKIKNIYIQLPFFLKVGIKNWTQQSITFENGCRIKSAARSKTPAIGFTIDFLYLDEFAHIPSNIIEPYYTAVYPVVSAIENSKIIITSTPNGMNLFWKLLTDSERPDGDPQKNNYKSMRVYWYQVEGRFVSYYKLNNHKLYDYGLTKDKLFELVKEKFGNLTKIEMKYSTEKEKDIIYLFNNEHFSDKMAKEFSFTDSNGREIQIHSVAEVSSWKEEAIKDIGGEAAFNQEYGLRFINSTKSLLSEYLIDNLLQNKKNYIYRQIEEFDLRLKFPYDGLSWVDDESVFSESNRKNIRGVISIDISEGLGQDYSVINIFKISPKSDELIEIQSDSYNSISDFFCLEQIGIYRTNTASVRQLSELFYCLLFEYFNYENFKVVLELNNYGHEFLAHLPNLYEGKNNYGSNVFFRYKHRVDSTEEKVGLKIGDNKNILVKEYQDNMDKKNFIITNENNISEITTFVKHITQAGNVRYAADVGHDDTVMTLVNASSVFSKYEFKEMVEEYSKEILDSYRLNKYQNLLGQKEYVEATDYQALINVNRRRRMFKQLVERTTRDVRF